MAGYGQGHALWLEFRREECIKAYQRVVKLSISEEDRGRKILGTVPPTTTTAGVEFDREVRLSRYRIIFRFGPLGALT